MPVIAVIGASNDRTKFGNKAVRAYLSQGFTVYPVNPKAEEIENLGIRLTFGQNAIGQVRPVETGDKTARLAQFQ